MLANAHRGGASCLAWTRVPFIETANTGGVAALIQPTPQLVPDDELAALSYADQGLGRLDGRGVDQLSPRVVTRELRLSIVLLVVTVVATVLSTHEAFVGLARHVSTRDLRAALEQAVLLVVLSFLIFGNLVHQLARLGYLRRRGRHKPVPDGELAAFAAEGVPSVVTLVPAYREERHVVAQTLLSAALQRYPNRIVLLIDDPPSPTEEDKRDAMRLLPAEIEARLARPAAQIRSRRVAFETRAAWGVLDRADEMLTLATLWDEAREWFADQAEMSVVADHTDAFFVEHILLQPGRHAADRAVELRRRTASGRCLDQHDLAQEFIALEHLFTCELTSFERKRYVNVSHEPNKAMNLNTYIDMMGRSFREVECLDGLHLVPVAGGAVDVEVPSTDYVVTLDADSLLSPDYVLRLVYELEREGNERIAVMQTPYCAIPGCGGRLERMAGATTDIQYIFHQGSTTYGATSWVGANAVLRRRALEDIRVTGEERGFLVSRYIQDRTVIEDTESSIDLIAAGWGLHNYPDRLAVSATPADFGALVIQRRRWANGGLIILPKLFRYLFSRPRGRQKLGEGVIRFHYLSSIAGANIGLLILLSYPFGAGLTTSAWLPLTAAPYFFLYARDLRHVGYRKRDMLGVYALNVALIPVNLAGVTKSIQQAITGKKLPFARTPKVSGRTRVPAGYVAAELVLLAYWVTGITFDSAAGRWAHALFGLVNTAMLTYALVSFVGVRHALADFGTPLKRVACESGDAG